MASPLGGSNDDDVAACMEKAVMTAMRIRRQRSDSQPEEGSRPCVVIGVDKLIPVSEGEDGIFREKQPERIYRGRYCHAR